MGRNGLTMTIKRMYDNDVGRPLLPDHLRKTQRHIVRFTKNELDDLRELSKEIGTPISRMIREGLGLFRKNLKERQGDAFPTKFERRKL